MRHLDQFKLIQIIRNYFLEQSFIDVITPPAVENPGMEVHIHPFQLYSVLKNNLNSLYLQTSPEFFMKSLLSEGYEKIFSIAYCFRDEPDSAIHRKQFLMLEWYRAQERYEVIMDDIEKLITYVLENGKKQNLIPRYSDLPFVRKTMQEIFQEEIGVDILKYLDVDSIKSLLSHFPDVPLPKEELEWDDYFFLLFLNKIEPNISKYPYLMITEFPAPLCALATLKANDPRVCERFEVYIKGIEICNCFNELTDAAEQRKRFEMQGQLKKKIYNYELPLPHFFYATIDKGLPHSSGIALGVERLLYSLFKVNNPFFN